MASSTQKFKKVAKWFFVFRVFLFLLFPSPDLQELVLNEFFWGNSLEIVFEIFANHAGITRSTILIDLAHHVCAKYLS